MAWGIGVWQRSIAKKYYKSTKHWKVLKVAKADLLTRTDSTNTSENLNFATPQNLKLEVARSSWLLPIWAPLPPSCVWSPPLFPPAHSATYTLFSLYWSCTQAQPSFFQFPLLGEQTKKFMATSQFNATMQSRCTLAMWTTSSTALTNLCPLHQPTPLPSPTSSPTHSITQGSHLLWPLLFSTSCRGWKFGRNALDKWSNSHFSTIKPKTTDYQLVYQGVLNLTAIVKENLVNKSCLKQHHTAWAGFGMWVMFHYSPLLANKSQ